MAENPNLVKVELRGDDGEVETLWAFDLGQDQYKLDNTPWYAYGVSTGDVIEAERQEPDGFPLFKRVVATSGYRTVRGERGQAFDYRFVPPKSPLLVAKERPKV